MQTYCKFPSNKKGATCPVCCFALPADFEWEVISICGAITNCGKATITPAPARPLQLGEPLKPCGGCGGGGQATPR